MQYKWISVKRQKQNDHNYHGFEVSNHPLKSTKQSSTITFIENINKWSAAFEEVDPLLRFEMNLEENNTPNEILDSTITNYAKVWTARRSSILNKYTTGEKLTIVSSFLPGGEKTLIRQVSNLNEKVKHRLEQLDHFDEGSVRKTIGLSQQEFVTKVNMLSDEIKKAWQSEQRVKAFKIAIQCSKLLSDVNVMQFYPSKFVLISDILDTFGNLVFNRLTEKSYGSSGKSISDIDPDTVPDSAKETCQNWLFKMASIRELLPRLYMEMSLLKCNVFISKKEDIEPIIVRLTLMIRGIGNPLVAVYLRLYLCRVASNLLQKNCEHVFNNNFKEFLEEYQQIFHPVMRKKYEGQLLTLDKYLSLYVPAVQDWLLYGALNTKQSKLGLLDQCLHQCADMENNELLLSCLVSAFDSASIVSRSGKILEIVRNSSDKLVMVHEVLTSLGEHLCSGSHKSGSLTYEALIQTWWKIASNITSTANFLKVLAPWLQFACTYLSTQHINIILRGTIRYMVKCGQPVDDFAANLQSVVKRMLNSIPDVEELFLMDAFMPLIELVSASGARTAMAKTVLSTMFARHGTGPGTHKIDDHVLIDTLMMFCRTLHDSINAVTLEDESKLCAELINKYIQLVTFHDALEQQLNFYVQCRTAFIKLDAVLITLVHCVNGVCVRAGVVAGVDAAAGGGYRWLQRACAAYCFVTVPSLRCALTKCQLYLLCGQVALLNNCVGQAEANFKALIGLIPDIPDHILEDGQKKPTNVRVSGMMSDFLSTLLILPDNVDSQCMAYILNGFIRTMEKVHWKKTDSLYYTTLLRTLDVLAEMTQETFSYSIDIVISNDKLYGSEPEFIEAIDKYSTNICQELLVVLKALEDAKETKNLCNLSLELFWRVVRRGDLTHASMFTLAHNLWLLSQKTQHSNNRYANSMLLALESDTNPASQLLLKKIKYGSGKA